MLHNTNPKNIHEIIRLGGDLLRKYSPTFKLDSELLLSFVLKKRREFLYSNFEKNISNKQYKSFLKLIEKRKKKYPIAYILGEKDFYGNLYKISSNTLIPRPETEQLVDITINKVAKYFKNNKNIRILEIGSGSGCIPITLKTLLKHKTIIYSCEISKKAFFQAKKNYKIIKPGRITFKNSDAFKTIFPRKKFDIVISNPPYLTKLDMDNINKEVSFEPKIALDGGLDGLLYFRKLFKLLNLQLKDKGFAIFEINENLGNKTAAIFKNEYSCEIIKDLFNKDRFIFISRQ